VRRGKLGVDDLLDMIAAQAKTNAAQARTITDQAKTNEKLQGQLDACLEQLKEIKAKQDGHPTQRLEESYSMSAEERRKARKS
jgi:uncharacterized coiled-coil protein SlyX